jgi:hypothetical protein
MMLDLLAADPETPLSLSEISRRLAINPSSAHAILHGLSEVGYVQRDDDLLWSLGPALVVIGAAAQRRHPQLTRARDAIADLARRHGVEGLLTTVVGDELLILESFNHTGSRATVGQRITIAPPVAAVHAVVEPYRSHWLSLVDDAQRRAFDAVLDDVAATGWIARQDARSQPQLRRSLRQLQTYPTDADARRAVADAAAELGELDAIVTAFDGRRQYDLAHIASLAVSPSGSIGLFLVGFREPLRGVDATRIAEELGEVGATVSRYPGHQRPDVSLRDVM